jgi:PAS domain S-box-containing protein
MVTSGGYRRIFRRCHHLQGFEGHYHSWNAAATRLFGYTPEEVIGRSILLLIPPELHSDEDEILARLQRGERINHFQTQRVKKNGERVDVSLTISPVRDSTGRVIGASKIARDITDRKRAEQALLISENWRPPVALRQLWRTRSTIRWNPS